MPIAIAVIFFVPPAETANLVTAASSTAIEGTKGIAVIAVEAEPQWVAGQSF